MRIPSLNSGDLCARRQCRQLEEKQTRRTRGEDPGSNRVSLGGLALPEEGDVGQHVVARSHLIEMLDAAMLALIQKVAQPLGVRLHGLGGFEEGFLGKECLDLIRHTLAIGIAIRFDRHPLPTASSVACLRSMASTAASKSMPTDSYFAPYRR